MMEVAIFQEGVHDSRPKPQPHPLRAFAFFGSLREIPNIRRLKSPKPPGTLSPYGEAQ